MATNQEAPTSRDQDTCRSFDTIYKSVCFVAKHGLGRGDDGAGQLGGLMWAARVIRYGSEDAGGQAAEEIDDMDMIEYALGHAISRMDGTGSKSMPALFGLTSDTRYASLAKRRECALRGGELAVALETFRIHIEKTLLVEVARILCGLADERLLQDREARLAEREAQLRAEATDQGANSGPSTPPNGDPNEFEEWKMPRRSAPSGSFFDDDDDDAAYGAQMVQPVVRRSASKQSENIASGLGQIFDGVDKICVFIIDSLGSSERYSNDLTPLQKLGAVALVLTFLLLVGSTLLGGFVIIEFVAHRIVEI